MADQGVGEIVKNIAKSYKRREVVEIHVCSHPKGKHRRKPNI